MRRTQTLDHKHAQREGNKIYEVRRDAYVPGAEEKDLLMIYTRYKRITIGSLRTLTRNPLTLKMGYIYKEKNKPQNSFKSGLETVLTRLSVDRPVDRPKCAVNRPVDRSMLSVITVLTENVCRQPNRPTQLSSSSLCNIGRSPGQSIQALCMSVDRPVDRSPVIGLKNSISCFCPLSLSLYDVLNHLTAMMFYKCLLLRQY